MGKLTGRIKNDIVGIQGDVSKLADLDNLYWRIKKPYGALHVVLGQLKRLLDE